MLVGFIATITSKLCSGFIMSFSYFAAAAALSVCSCAPVCVRSYGFLCSSCSQSHSIVFIFVNFVFQFASIVYVLHFVWRANFIRLRNGFASSSLFLHSSRVLAAIHSGSKCAVRFKFFVRAVSFYFGRLLLLLSC